jgi:hypothetical protein
MLAFYIYVFLSGGGESGMIDIDIDKALMEVKVCKGIEM